MAKGTAGFGSPEHCTVNIISTNTDKNHQIEQCQQVSGDPGREIETVIASGGTVAGIPTIYIPGYSGPA